MAQQYICGDILQFQEQLKNMRALDDKVIYSLNMALPTASMARRSESNPESNCKSLFDNLKGSYNGRQKVINDCVLLTAKQVTELKKQLEGDEGNTQLEKKFKSEQRKLRVLKQEQTVEEIVKVQTMKAFNERCRLHYFDSSNSF